MHVVLAALLAFQLVGVFVYSVLLFFKYFVFHSTHTKFVEGLQGEVINSRLTGLDHRTRLTGLFGLVFKLLLMSSTATIHEMVQDIHWHGENYGAKKRKEQNIWLIHPLGNDAPNQLVGCIIQKRSTLEFYNLNSIIFYRNIFLPIGLSCNAAQSL